MTKRPPAWMLPNLLSLDAPLVALVWMWMLARSTRVQYVESSSYIVLAGAVWCVYVLDRIRDVKRGKHELDGEMPWRHRFHWQSRWVLLVLVGIVVAYCSYASLFILSMDLLTIGIVGGLLVVLYCFVSVFDRGDVAYWKNFIAGMTFAFGVAAPIAVASEPLPIVVSDVVEPFVRVAGAGGGSFVTAFFVSIAQLLGMVFASLHQVLLSVHVLLFALLCVMNINAIDLWERSRRSDDILVKQESELSLTIGLMALIVGSVLAAAFWVDDYSAPLCYAVMASGALLQFINRRRSRFSLDALRVMADLALILPAPLVLWLV
ncbi:hypothetical protein ACFPK9_12715 [Rubritalea spongiae]|uniref:Prenyltransferase n=1 Tax=Rubritalea spongiae TaxID=430797 RepID=A0ABW5E1X5_9BACT